MNPLAWKREHRIALYLAAAIGALLGAVIVGMSIEPHIDYYEYRAGFRWDLMFSEHWALMLFWPLLGAVIGASLIYIRQLMRA